MYHIIRIDAIGDGCDETMGHSVFAGTLEECEKEKARPDYRDNAWSMYPVMSDEEWNDRLIHYRRAIGND